jgi:hypothetical protein
MENGAPDGDIDAILARLDRSTPDALLKSLAGELLRLHQAYAGLLARVTAIEVSQTIHDRVASKERSRELADLPHSVMIDALSSLSARAGFYALEYDQAGNAYRWTGPEPVFFFEILLNRQSAALLRMRYSRLLVEFPNQKVRCYVDGEEIQTELVRVEGEFESRIVVPPRAGSGGTVIMFVCPGVAAPVDLQLSNDARKLGLAFRWLRIDRLAPEIAPEATNADAAPIFGPIAAPSAALEAMAPRPRRARSAGTARGTASERIRPS